MKYELDHVKMPDGSIKVNATMTDEGFNYLKDQTLKLSNKLMENEELIVLKNMTDAAFLRLKKQIDSEYLRRQAYEWPSSHEFGKY
jgi:hypothetical protein